MAGRARERKEAADEGLGKLLDTSIAELIARSGLGAGRAGSLWIGEIVSLSSRLHAVALWVDLLSVVPETAPEGR